MNLAVFGDSWSCHSYKKGENFKEEPGILNFQDMFANVGIQAKNYSVYASSNQGILNRLKQTNLENFDVAVIFQTDPLRNIIDRNKVKATGYQIKSSNLVDIAEDILLQFYQELSQIKIPILLIGGLSCIAHQLVPKNIRTIEQSWTELVDPEFKDCYFEWVEFTELVCDYLKCNTDLTEIQQQILTKNNIWQKSDYFGWCHPSDKGYEIMFHELVKKLI